MTKMTNHSEEVKDEIIQTLKDHALENYSHKKLRYDYFIETFDKAEWVELCERYGWQIAKIKTEMKSMARMWAEQESNCW